MWKYSYFPMTSILLYLALQMITFQLHHHLNSPISNPSTTSANQTIRIRCFCCLHTHPRVMPSILYPSQSRDYIYRRLSKSSNQIPKQSSPTRHSLTLPFRLQSDPHQSHRVIIHHTQGGEEMGSVIPAHRSAYLIKRYAVLLGTVAAF